jgi:hypothetical protein
MHNTYEWLLQLTVEFGISDDSTYREEGQVRRMQGRCAVLVHASSSGTFTPAAESEAVLETLSAAGVSTVLVISNAPDHLIMGSYRPVLGNLFEFPQGLGSLACSVLTTPLVFIEFQDRLVWRYVNYLWEDPYEPPLQLRPGSPDPAQGSPA